MRVSPSRTRRLATTMSAPSRQRWTSSGISSGGSWRSPSSITTASPVAWSSPAVIAICGRTGAEVQRRASAGQRQRPRRGWPGCRRSSRRRRRAARTERPRAPRRPASQNSRASPPRSIGATTLQEPQLAHAAPGLAARVRSCNPASPCWIQDLTPGCRGQYEGCEHVFVSYGSSLPLRLLVPGRRLAARRAGAAPPPSSGYGAMALTDHNSVSGSMEFAQAAGALGLRAIHGAEIDLDDGRHLTLLVEDAAGLAQPMPDPHARVRSARGRKRRAAAGVPLETVEEHAEGLVCLSGCARQGVRDEPTMRRLLAAFGPNACGSELPAPVPAQRPHAQPRAVLAGRAAGDRVRGDRERPRARALARPAAGRVRGTAQPHDAGRLRARAARQLRPRARFARRRWRPASRTIRRRSRRRSRWPTGCASTCDSDLGYRYPGSEDADAGRTLAELCWVEDGRALPGRAPLHARRARPAGRGAARDRGARAARLLHPAPRPARARRGRWPSRCAGRTRRARCCRRGAGADHRCPRSFATSPASRTWIRWRTSSSSAASSTKSSPRCPTSTSTSRATSARC